MNSIITSLVNEIGKANPEFTNIQLKKMEYGLVCFFNEITKFIPYYIVFYLFGAHKYFLVSLFFLSLLRLFTGGYHAKTYFGCFSFSFVLMIIIVYIGKTAAFNHGVSAILLLSSFVLVYLFSPVDNVNKRIISVERRLRLKYISVVITALLSILVFIIPLPYRVTALTSISAAVILMLAGLLMDKTGNTASDL